MNATVRARGFTLLEVLVAFALLATAVGLLLAIVSGGVRQVRQAAQASEVAALAQSLIAPLGVEVPLEPGELTGESEDGRWHWRLRVEEVIEPPPVFQAAAAATGDEAAEPAEVELTQADALSVPLLYRIDLELRSAGEQGRPWRFGTLRLRLAQTP